MQLNKEQFATQEQIIARVENIAHSAQKHGMVVEVLMPSNVQAQTFKRRISKCVSAGIEVQNYEYWLGEMWDIFGDGNRLVSSLQRELLARTLLEKVIGRVPSNKYVAQFAHFLSEAVMFEMPAELNDDFSEVEQNVLHAIQDYRKLLKKHNLVEVAQIEAFLPIDAFRNRCLIFVDIVLKGQHQEKAIESFGTYTLSYWLSRTVQEHSKMSIKDFDNELQLLYAMLYSGETGLTAKGSVFLGEAHGAHCSNELTLELIKKLLAGNQNKKIALVVPNASELSEELFQKLAQANLSFFASFSLPLSQTKFGSAFLNLLSIRKFAQENLVFAERKTIEQNEQKSLEKNGQEGLENYGRITLEHNNAQARGVGKCLDERDLEKNKQIALEQSAQESPFFDECYEQMVDFVISPYSGIDEHVAASLQKQWRKERRATFAKRWRMIASNTNLLDLSLNEQECVQYMFENANSNCKKYAKTSELYIEKKEALFDDVAAANAILDYFDECNKLDINDIETIADISVLLTRRYGSKETIKICLADDVHYALYDYVLLTNLESGIYSMSHPSDSFNRLRTKMSLSFEENYPDEQRLKLLALLENAQEGFAAYRVCHNDVGDEVCASALWEELLSPYRYSSKEDADTDIQEIPHTFYEANAVVRISEAQVFLSGHKEGEQDNKNEQNDKKDDMASNQCISFNVVRGKLQREESFYDLLPNYSEFGEVFSPTAIEALYRCPYQWFINNRVGVKSIDVGFESYNIGNLAHDALYEFYVQWKQAGNERVTSKNVTDAQVLAGQVFDRCFEKHVQEKRLIIHTQSEMIKCEQTRKQILDFIERDAEFLPKFKPWKLELELSSDEELGPLYYAGIPVRGKVDRIDINEAGELVIIDYKMSSLSEGYGLPLSGFPKRIQTDIYAALVQQFFERLGEKVKVVGSVYRSYTKNALRGAFDEKLEWGSYEDVYMIDALPQEKRVYNYQKHIEIIEKTVHKRLAQLKAGDITPALGNNKICTYCNAKLFCEGARK